MLLSLSSNKFVSKTRFAKSENKLINEMYPGHKIKYRVKNHSFFLRALISKNKKNNILSHRELLFAPAKTLSLDFDCGGSTICCRFFISLWAVGTQIS